MSSLVGVQYADSSACELDPDFALTGKLITANPREPPICSDVKTGLADQGYICKKEYKM